MSGARSHRRNVGGGIVVLGGISGLVAGGTTCIALRDREVLPAEEREARCAGRYCAVGEAAVGVGVAVHAVGAVGLAGYSAAGLAGLGALGSLLGGGMAQGVPVTTLIPALLAAGIGYLAYRVSRWLLSPPPPEVLASEAAGA